MYLYGQKVIFCKRQKSKFISTLTNYNNNNIFFFQIVTQT